MVKHRNVKCPACRDVVIRTGKPEQKSRNARVPQEYPDNVNASLKRKKGWAQIRGMDDLASLVKREGNYLDPGRVVTLSERIGYFREFLGILYEVERDGCDPDLHNEFENKRLWFVKWFYKDLPQDLRVNIEKENPERLVLDKSGFKPGVHGHVQVMQQNLMARMERLLNQVNKHSDTDDHANASIKEIKTQFNRLTTDLKKHKKEHLSQEIWGQFRVLSDAVDALPKAVRRSGQVGRALREENRKKREKDGDVQKVMDGEACVQKAQRLRSVGQSGKTPSPRNAVHHTAAIKAAARGREGVESASAMRSPRVVTGASGTEIQQKGGPKKLF
eukprot:1364513-Rhodomonas_salina.2